MKKAKYNEVPKEYRRNYKKEAVEFLMKMALAFGAVIFIILIIAKF